MTVLTEEQLNNLGKEALVLLVSTLQEQLKSMSAQLDNYSAQLDAANAQLEVSNSQITELTRKIDQLTEQILVMNQRQFGRHSESKLNDQCEGQLSVFDIFNEAEVSAAPDAPEPEIEEITISYTRPRKGKETGKRETDLEGLPARIFEHTLSEEELKKKFPEGYKELPPYIYKRLFIIPETFLVDEHHVHIYASKANDKNLVRAPRPVDLFRGSIATPALVASILNGKYVNAMPLERQSKAFRTNGINLASNTMANWVIKSSEMYLSLIYDKLHKWLYENHVIHADETPVKVMRIDGEKIHNGKKSYMWVYRNEPASDAKEIILYDWRPSRKTDHPREFLKQFSGIVVTDGYQVYHTLSRERQDLKIAGCWVHARRPYAEFIKSVGIKNAKGTVAEEAYARISEIMHLDNGFDDLSGSDRLNQRQLVLKEKVDDYFAWVKLKYDQVAHNSEIGKALAYSIHQEQYLKTFLTDGDVPMDNNYAEQAIRPFTVGRKNFVLMESDNGAKASAIIYSIVETAKANHLNTYQYLELLLTEVPKHMEDKSLRFLDDLMPWAEDVQKKCPSLINKK